MNEEEMQKMLNRQVTVFKTDGFVKKGELVCFFENFIKLKFYNGTEELIPFVQISGIRMG